MCTKDWYSVFSSELHRECFTQEEILQIYKTEMEARTFFDFDGIVSEFLVLQNIERDSEKIQYYWDSHSSKAMCPFCGTMSNKECKDYFEKPLQDIPQDRLAVYHVVRSKKYFCEYSDCSYTRFVERLDGFTEENARKTVRFKKYCVERSLEGGCKPAEDALKREGAVISNDSIARYLKIESAKKIESHLKCNDVKVLSIDEEEVYGNSARLVVIRSSSSLKSFETSQEKKKDKIKNAAKKIGKKTFSCKKDAEE